MSESKVLFVKQFLARLSAKGIRTIPINDDNFKRGIASMADYFEGHIECFGSKADQLSLLFLKYSTRGDYNQFAKIIESFNGRIVSLENPHYIRANLKIEDEYVERLVENDELGIAACEFERLVECFVEGAGISYAGNIA